MVRFMTAVTDGRVQRCRLQDGCRLLSLSVQCCLQPVYHFPPDSWYTYHFTSHLTSPSDISISSSQIAPRLAPPRGRHLSLAAGQCANQLIHTEVFVLGEQTRQRPRSFYCMGTRVSEPVNWRVMEKRCKVTEPSVETQYGTPSVATQYGTPSVATQYATPSVATHYGTPSVATHYGTPSVATHYGTPSVATHYGTPSVATHYGTPSVATHYGMPNVITQYGTPSVASQYGTPSVATQYGTPSVASQYGTSSVAGDKNMYELTVEETCTDDNVVMQNCVDRSSRGDDIKRNGTNCVHKSARLSSQ